MDATCATAGKHASRWSIEDQPDGTFKVATAAMSPDKNAAVTGPLCWSYAGSTAKCIGCLVLGPCTSAPAFNHTQDGAIVNAQSHLCVDLDNQGALGSWECGRGQPNQRFGVDSMTGMVISGAAGYGGEASYAGTCASVPVGPDA